MDVQQLLLSFDGRIGRKTFWVWNLVYYSAIIVFIFLTNKIMPSLAHLMLPLFLIVMLYPDLAITAKRWHDRDKSSWFLLLNIPLVIGRMTMPVGEAAQSVPPSTIQTISSFAAIVCGLWILIECGFLKGTSGDNQYGPEPK